MRFLFYFASPLDTACSIRMTAVLISTTLACGVPSNISEVSENLLHVINARPVNSGLGCALLWDNPRPWSGGCNDMLEGFVVRLGLPPTSASSTQSGSASSLSPSPSSSSTICSPEAIAVRGIAHEARRALRSGRKGRFWCEQTKEVPHVGQLIQRNCKLSVPRRTI